MRVLLLALLMVLPSLAQDETPPPPETAKPPTEAEVREAAKTLGDRQESARSAGMSLLASYGKHAQVVLRELSTSDDPEVRWRARLLLGRPKLVSLGTSNDVVGPAFVVIYLEAEKGEEDPQAIQVQVGPDPVWVERKPVADARGLTKAAPKPVEAAYGIGLSFDAAGAKALNEAAARGKGRRLVLAIDGRGAHAWTLKSDTIGPELIALSGMPIQAAQQFARAMELGRKVE